jgi:hypothetical protein
MRGITSATSNKPNPRYAHLPDKAESVFNDYDRYLDVVSHHVVHLKTET